MITVYGIPNCDSVKKARDWLATRGIDYTFHDFRKQGIDTATLHAWLASPIAPLIVNRKGTTWRKLDDTTRAACDTDPVPVLAAHTSLIKRPVIDTGTTLLAGFDPARYAEVFA